jgi:hypothetical protein
MNTPLSACEIKQLLAMNADDIDQAENRGPLDIGPLTNIIGPSRLFPSSRGWDPYYGYGRLDAERALAAVREGRIPPEAEIREPAWFDLLNPGRITLDITGRVAAVRADTYRYTVEFAAGWNPSDGQWTTAFSSASQYEPVDGVLATLDLGEVYRKIQETMPRETEAEDCGDYAFTVRVRVRDSQGNWGEDRRVLYCFNDPDAYGGTPLRMGVGITASPRFADLDGDGTNELVVATDEGYVHAYRSDFSELPGWPVHATPLALHVGSAAFTTSVLSAEAYGSVTGTPAVGDIDHDGSLEVVAGDSEGRIYAWDSGGQLMPGFPVRSNPLYSIPDREDWWREGALPAEWFAARFVPDRVHRLDAWNVLDKAFLGGPALYNLDGSVDGSLEIIASCQDRHVYAWHKDGTAVSGWPVKLADPEMVTSFNPLTHLCSVGGSAGAAPRGGIIPPPAVGDNDGDCRPEVVCASNEVYGGHGGVSADSFGLLSSWSLLKPLLGDIFEPAGVRVYALHGDGASHGLAPGTGLPPEQLPSNAYLEGWPARLATLAPKALSYAAAGFGGPPALADVDEDKTMEVGVCSAAGPAFVLEPDGSSHLGVGSDGLSMSLECNQGDAEASSRDWPVMCALGGGCFAGLGQGAMAFVAPTMGLGRFMDTLLPASQDRSDDQVSAWNSLSGEFLASFPLKTGGAMLLSTPGAADIDGDSIQEIMAGGACGYTYFLRAGEKDERRRARFTGGWSTAAPAVADFDGDGRREVATGTREGWLLVWATASRDSDPADWPQYAHDLWGTSCLENDAARPGRVGDLAARMTVNGEGRLVVELAWSAPGDDDYVGQALCYDIRCLDRPLDDSNWDEAFSLQGKPLPAAPGSPQSWVVEEFAPGGMRDGSNYYFALRTRDEAGNISAISNLAYVSF